MHVSARPLDYAEALKDPGSFFDTPGAVVKAAGLRREQKMEILKRWEADARLLMVASDESMSGGEQPQLQDVQEAMRELEADSRGRSNKPGKNPGSKLGSKLR
jgi:hypothetical protein